MPEPNVSCGDDGASDGCCQPAVLFEQTGQGKQTEAVADALKELTAGAVGRWRRREKAG